jgi:hypothetical protein
VAQLIFTGLVNGVVDCGAAAGARVYNLISKLVRFAGEVLQNLRLIVEGHHKCSVLVATQDAIEKIHGGILLELDAVSDAVGSIKEHPYAEREIGLARKETDGLLDVVIENLEIVLFEIRNELIAVIEHGEKNIDEVDRSGDGLVDALGRFLALSRVRFCRRGGRV